MDDMKKIITTMSVGMPILIFLVFFIVLTSSESASGDSSVIVAINGFSVPLSDYYISSGSGMRLDPFGSGEIKYHPGTDFASPCGTEVVASADGIIYDVGYEVNGLGNYIYMEHNSDMGKIYTAYGHLLEDSIIVSKNEPVTQGQVIAQVGTSGASTGCHLHFMIMKGKVSYKAEDQIDASFVISGLN